MRTPRDKPGWKEGFLFVGNELVLDFLNTHPIPNGEPVELLPDFGALLRWFRAAKVLNSKEVIRLQNQWGDTPRARKITESMRKLREGLRKAILAWEHRGTLRRSTMDALNRLMLRHTMRTRLTVRGKIYSTELWFQLRKPEDLYTPLVYSAVKLFSEVDRGRVRKCDHCVLHFHDRSKKGKRRWCSMQLCGNRLKVAAYAARQRRHAHK